MMRLAEAGNEKGVAFLSAAPKLEWPYYYHAFADLSTERQVGMGPGPIPYSAIRALAVEDNLTPSETETLKQVVRALDNHFLAKQAEKSRAHSRDK